MTKIKFIMVMVALLLGCLAYAQQPSQTEESTNAGQQVNHPRQATSAAQQQLTDTTGMASNKGSTTADTSSTAGGGQAPSTPALSQSTSSSSGSPAILTGEQRDGTNNVQRATMNMAGAPAGNLNLDAGKSVDVDTELRDRQNRSQEKQVSAQKSTGGDAPDTGEINEKSRKENNALSDQNLSSKDKRNQGAVNKESGEKKENKTGKKAPVSKEKG